jgi:hypothetical protein
MRKQAMPRNPGVDDRDGLTGPATELPERREIQTFELACGSGIAR